MTTLTESWEQERALQEEIKRLQITWEAQESARQALVAILRVVGGAVTVPHGAWLLTDDEALEVEDDPLTGSRTFRLRVRRPPNDQEDPGT